MITASDIPVLTDAEKLELAEDIHAAVVKFKLLQASTFWCVETFWVRDLAGELTTRQAKWFVPYVGLLMRQRSDADTMNLPIELPDDLTAAAGESYVLSTDCKPTKLSDQSCLSHPILSSPSSIGVLRLVFSKQKRLSRRAA